MNDEPQTFEELAAQALEAGEDKELYWHVVDVLQKRADRETLDKVFELSRGEVTSRKLASDVLGRYSVFAPSFAANPVFSQEIVARLLEMLAIETEVEVVESLAAALSNQPEEPRIFEALRVLVGHSHWRVRWQVSQGLSDYCTPASSELLMQLMEDEDEMVRNWATFGLGDQLETDTLEIRAALARHLDDEDEETRAGAIFGLAKRHDKRAIDAIAKEFAAGFSGTLLFQAILELPAVCLLPALLKMSAIPKFPRRDIQAAIAACEAH